MPDFTGLPATSGQSAVIRCSPPHSTSPIAPLAMASGAIPITVNESSMATLDSLTVIGIAPEAIASGAIGLVECGGLHLITADCPLVAGNPVKSGIDGRASKYTTAQ